MFEMDSLNRSYSHFLLCQTRSTNAWKIALFKLICLNITKLQRGVFFEIL